MFFSEKNNGQFDHLVSFPTHDLVISRGGSMVTTGSTTSG